MGITVPHEMPTARFALPGFYLARVGLVLTEMVALSVFTVAVTYAVAVLGIVGMARLFH